MASWFGKISKKLPIMPTLNPIHPSLDHPSLYGRQIPTKKSERLEERLHIVLSENNFDYSSSEVVGLQQMIAAAKVEEKAQEKMDFKMSRPVAYRNNNFFLGRDLHPLALLAQRLRMPEGECFPFEHIDCYANNESVYLFYVHNGTFSHHVDDAKLFPSDELLAVLKVVLSSIQR